MSKAPDVSSASASSLGPVHHLALGEGNNNAWGQEWGREPQGGRDQIGLAKGSSTGNGKEKFKQDTSAPSKGKGKRAPSADARVEKEKRGGRRASSKGRRRAALVSIYKGYVSSKRADE